MPRVQVYPPGDLHEELEQRGLPASELLQIALRAELERQDALDATERYLAELSAELGDPNQRQRSHASDRFLKTCIIDPEVSEATARRAARLRRLARAGSAVDALLVALAEPGGAVITGDRADLEALAAHADPCRHRGHLTVDRQRAHRGAQQSRGGQDRLRADSDGLTPSCTN